MYKITYKKDNTFNKSFENGIDIYFDDEKMSFLDVVKVLAENYYDTKVEDLGNNKLKIYCKEEDREIDYSYIEEDDTFKNKVEWTHSIFDSIVRFFEENEINEITLEI